MGGGAIRTLARAASLGGYRSVCSLAGHPTVSREPKPSSAAVSTQAPTVEPGTSISIVSCENGLREAASVSSIHGSPWEIEDWEFASWEEDEKCVSLDSLHSAPRLVFGPVPTLEEARDATSDLKDAIEKVYLSPSADESSPLTVHMSIPHEALSIIPSIPRHIVQTFSLLQGSPEAQEVVASLASDKNVWNAVMNNTKVMEFYRTHQSIVLQPESESNTEVPVVDNNSESSAAKTGNSPFADFVNNVKVKVATMISNVSSILEELIGISPGTPNSTSTNDSPHTNKPFAEFALGASFMALAVAAILVVLLKRG
ncbi:hypothetical protein Cni_G13889 [Canna indica]|uniref:Uncharacterized protein n=1 Tax=Canna indica TaxID=4628 RepID=A0AAQ3KAD2_9LILI|nr:hypothetical protein Cni_G13889 [Canna indica]